MKRTSSPASSVHLFKVRYAGFADAAPACPKTKDNRLAAQVGESDLVAVAVEYGEVGRGLQIVTRGSLRLAARCVCRGGDGGVAHPAEGAVERSRPGDKDDEGERSDNEELFAVHGSFIFAAGTGCCFVSGLRILRRGRPGGAARRGSVARKLSEHSQGPCRRGALHEGDGFAAITASSKAVGLIGAGPRERFCPVFIPL